MNKNRKNKRLNKIIKMKEKIITAKKNTVMKCMDRNKLINKMTI